jgi:hypothetical protein
MFYYKYVPPERVDVLLNLLIRYTQPTAQNDPFEFRLIGDLIFRDAGVLRTLASDFIQFIRYEFENEILGRAADGLEHALTLSQDVAEDRRDALLSEQVSMAWDLLRNRYGILSLTDDPANLLMWAHYTASHTGFLIGFEGDNLWFEHNRIPEDESKRDCAYDLRLIRKVKYIDVGVENSVSRVGKDLFHVKSKLWEYESEWRMLRPLDKHHTKIGKDVFLFRVPPSSISSVILGVRSSSALESEIKKIIGDNGNLQHVYVGRAKESSSSIRVPTPQTRNLVSDEWLARVGGRTSRKL